MRLFGFLSLFIWLLIFVVLAVMFDWFGAREGARAVLNFLEVALNALEAFGDSAQEFIQSVKETADEKAFEMPKIPEMPDMPDLPKKDM